MTLSQAYKAGLCIELVRATSGPDELLGVILKLSSSWCLLASLDSLDPDGYWIIRRDTVRRVRYRRFEAFRHRILVAKGTISRLRPPRGIDITTTDSLMISLVSLRRYAVLYRENDTEWWSLHAAILEEERGRLRLHGFDGAGVFESRIRSYPVADITCVRFGGRYLQEYQSAAPYDYVKQRPVTVAQPCDPSNSAAASPP